MESIAKPSSNIAEQATKATQPNLSPYLKAILSGATRLINAGRSATIVNPDREAAIRYIKESALLKK
jgi:hypothetical protein